MFLDMFIANMTIRLKLVMCSLVLLITMIMLHLMYDNNDMSIPMHRSVQERLVGVSCIFTFVQCLYGYKLVGFSSGVTLYVANIIFYHIFFSYQNSNFGRFSL